MHFTSLVASALLLASVGLASPTPATEGTLKARLLKDVALKSVAATNLARQNFARWSCPAGKVAGCCASEDAGPGARLCFDSPSPAPPGNTGLYNSCTGGTTAVCCNSIQNQFWNFGIASGDMLTGNGCAASTPAPNQKYTCETTKQALCCHTIGMDGGNPVGCLGPKVPSTTTVIGGRNLYYACAASKTARCCASSSGNTSNPNGNMGGTGCVDPGSPSTFNE